MKSLRSTSMRACSLPAAPSGSSTGWIRQLLNMGKSSPRLISLTSMLERYSGLLGPLSADVREVSIALS